MTYDLNIVSLQSFFFRNHSYLIFILLKNQNISQTIKSAGLRLTPQRTAVLEALIKSKHPTADKLTEIIRKTNPHIATGTIYKILETFVTKGLVKKVDTQSEVMRYDAILESHHHLYCENTDRIEDYYDNELRTLISKYLEKKKIQNFKVSEIKIQLVGNFTDKK